MFTPSFTITNKILNYISKIEAAEEVIRHAPLLPLWEKQFKEDAIVRSVYHGTHLEGNKLHKDEAKDVLLGKEVLGRPRDIQEIINYREVIDFIDLEANKKIDIIVGIDARGFILAAALAYKLKTGLAIIRKKGKLPFKTIAKKYSLEYASEVIEMHQDAIKPGQKVLLIDDVLATGGTMRATIEIVKKLKGKIVGISFLIILEALQGEKRLKGYQIDHLIEF